MIDRPIRILCMEDNQLVAEAISRKLDREGGFEWLGWVQDSEALLDRVRATKPDVISMDLDMPRVDAFALIGKIKQTVPQSRVMVLSGHVSADLVQRAIESGAAGYLSKAEESRAIVESYRQVAKGALVLGRLSQDAWNDLNPPAPEPEVKAKPSLLRRFPLFKRSK